MEVQEKQEEEMQLKDLYIILCSTHLKKGDYHLFVLFSFCI